MNSFPEKRVTVGDSDASRVVPDFRRPIKKATGHAGQRRKTREPLLAQIHDFGNVSPAGIAGFRRPMRPGAGLKRGFR
jgi:hypothetical protein